MIPPGGKVLTPAQYGAVAPPGGDWPFNKSPRWMYAVNRMYPTVQGEGVLTGTPMTIVRLQGCPVGCVFCDTPETWTATVPKHGAWSAAYIAKHAAEFTPKWILVTGGEPLWHDCEALTTALHEAGFLLALETSGVYAPSGSWDHVCVSPKPAGFRQFNPRNLLTAQEIKWLVGRIEDVAALEHFLGQFFISQRIQIVVQPISLNQRATRICLRALEVHPTWRLSLQTHKLLDIA